MMKFIKKLCLIMIVFMAVQNGFSLRTCAADSSKLPEDDAADNEANGIVKIVTAYADESGNIYYAKQGTGFVIGVKQGNNDRKYIVSDYGVVQSETEYLDAIRKKYGLAEDNKLSAVYYAIGDMGVLSELNIYSFSNETRYVVLEPSGALADKELLKLGDGDSVVSEARIHIEGYNGERSIVSDSAVDERSINVYDTVITDVKTEEYYNDEITYFYVGENIDEGMAGAPVLDRDGCVIGMFIMDNEGIRAMSVEDIRVILDALSVSYMVAEDDTSYDVPTWNQRTELKKMIVDNKEYISSIAKNRYTQKTWEALYNAISKADSVYLNSDSTAKQYDDSIVELKKARKKLRTKAFKWIVINIVAGVVILALTLVLFRVLRKRKRLNLQRKRITKMSAQG